MEMKLITQRRDLLKAIGYVAVAIPFVGLVGCGAGNSQNDDNSSTDDTSSDAGDDSSTDVGSIEWAAGGTELITVDYPDDSLFETTSICSVALIANTTEGPCYFSVNEIEDISAGRTGLPMMLCLKVIDTDCNPVEGYVVEVWHCDKSGVYSADTSESDDSNRFAGNFCSGGDVEAENSTWFRGEQTTDSNGRVNFKSCFPGWYSGRTIHIHFRVRNGSVDSVISQLCFSDDFCEEICTTHSEYSDRGTQDTPLSSGRDTVFGSDYEEHQSSVMQNTDGTLLAYKTLQILL